MGTDKLIVPDTKVIRFMTDDSYRLLRHAVLLLGILAILCFSKDATEYKGSITYLKVLFIYIALVAMCYINMNILVPMFFFRDKYTMYLLALFILVFISLTTISNVIDLYFPDPVELDNSPESKRGFYEGIVILIPIILVTTMIKLFQRWMRDNERIRELNNITLTMELNELRNQINPHFLFNMLNGIKSLVRVDPEKATTVIMKLSEFLRYQLYENDEERTLLRSEINFLSNFLDLEKLRRDNLSVDISTGTETKMINSIFLPPNLFTTFVENAVKHSADINGAGSFIRITINVIGDKLIFDCVNSKDPSYTQSSNGKTGGLGLGNIKRRLALLYGHKYSLDLQSALTRYEVKLTIPI